MTTMSILAFLLPPRTSATLDDAIAKRRMMESWLATGVVPVAHIVADLDAEGDSPFSIEIAATPRRRS